MDHRMVTKCSSGVARTMESGRTWILQVVESPGVLASAVCFLVYSFPFAQCSGEQTVDILCDFGCSAWDVREAWFARQLR